ncbi:hypothetical protein COU61_00955 [Candidatus Pacearchaeota archaeon CG10_big_fil_rev_8_21_14_0_10_35_13]|nr:MAG: hypothetical protein COU61_00955 [Candidatus Pacearchaeota archaeon CG10_big_fil_rev_8_21_14_0_10_35_13]
MGLGIYRPLAGLVRSIEEGSIRMEEGHLLMIRSLEEGVVRKRVMAYGGIGIRVDYELPLSGGSMGERRETTGIVLLLPETTAEIGPEDTRRKYTMRLPEEGEVLDENGRPMIPLIINDKEINDGHTRHEYVRLCGDINTLDGTKSLQELKEYRKRNNK